MKNEGLRSAIVRLCQPSGFLTEHTYELIEQVVASIAELDPNDEPETTTFNDMTITVYGKPQEAYDRLCDVLNPKTAAAIAGYSTDTYSCSTDADAVEHPTSDLFPEDSVPSLLGDPKGTNHG